MDIKGNPLPRCADSVPDVIWPFDVSMVRSVMQRIVEIILRATHQDIMAEMPNDGAVRLVALAIACEPFGKRG